VRAAQLCQDMEKPGCRLQTKGGDVLAQLTLHLLHLGA
jgi:hypothetical protein